MVGSLASMALGKQYRRWPFVCLMLDGDARRESTVGNGQYGLLVLVLWCVRHSWRPGSTDGRAMVSGVSFVKFNFAPALFLYLLMKSGLRRALMSLVPVLAWSCLSSASWVWASGTRCDGCRSVGFSDSSRFVSPRRDTSHVGAAPISWIWSSQLRCRAHVLLSPG